VVASGGRRKARSPSARASGLRGRTARKPSSVPASVAGAQVVIIPLGPALPQASSDTPGGFGRAALERLPIRSCSGWGLPRDRCHHRPGELLPHRFTLTASALASGRGGLFSVALSSGSPPPAVGWHPALWSSDFPLVTRARARVTSDHPSLSDAPRMTEDGHPSMRGSGTLLGWCAPPSSPSASLCRGARPACAPMR
jgi:hypothetical protein